jgi:hypothetical protein
MATIDDLLGSPEFLRQLIGEEQFEKTRQQALNQGILQASLAALGTGGRGTAGQAISQAGQAGLQGYQSSFDRTLSDMAKSMQIREMAGGKSPELSKEQQQYAFQKYGSAKFSALPKEAQQDVLDFGQRPDVNKALEQYTSAQKLFADTGIDIRPAALENLNKARGITAPTSTGMPAMAVTSQAPTQAPSQAPVAQEPSLAAGLPPTEQIKLRAKEAEKTMEAQRALPQAVETAKQTVDAVDKLITHKGFSNLVGAGVPFGKFVAGSETAGANALFEQIKGKSFLEAFQSLKGGGQITEKEGAKAEAAINRMNLTTSEKDFKEAAKDFKDAVQAGINRASKSAGETPADVVGVDISAVPADAISLLKKNPRLAPQFDQKYGKGASAKVLGRKN